MKIQSVSIDSVMVDPANVRVHPERNMETIKASLARFGQQKPLVVDGDNIVRAGNGTLEAARALGWQDIKIIRTPLKGSEATAYAIADNRSSELAEWDDAALASTLKALQDEEFDLAAIGYTDDELEDLLSDLADDAPGDGTPPEDPGPQIDRADELQKKWGTALGQLWLIPSKTASGVHRLLCGDSTKPEDVTRACDGQVQMCVTSPPYWGLRSYGIGTENGELGLEATPEAFTAAMVGVFAEVKRVLRDDGVAWVNLGDSYASTKEGNTNGLGSSSSLGADKGVGSRRAAERWGQMTSEANANRKSVIPPGLKPKDLVGIPWRVAFALQADGWYLRSDIIWHKPNPMPESVTDRPTKSHEYVFLMAKQERYYWDQEAVREKSVETWTNAKFSQVGRNADMAALDPALYRTRGIGTHHDYDERSTRNLRSVWTITPQPFKEAHFATFPVELASRCIAAGTSERGACPTCGAAWEREVERAPGLPRDRQFNPLGGGELPGRTGNGCSGLSNTSGAKLAAWRELHPTKHLGWRTTCSHDAEPQPCTVFDPFMGAATTIVACEQLGRLGRGIELSPQYVAIALERLAGMGLEPFLQVGG